MLRGTTICAIFFLFFGLYLSAQSEQIVYINASDTKVVQIINNTMALARLAYDGRWETHAICVAGLPTKGLYDGSNLHANADGKVVLVEAGTQTFVSDMGVTRTLRKFSWPAPERIKKESQEISVTEDEVCTTCQGEGRLQKKHKGELGRKICPACKGKKSVKKKTKYESVKIWLDGDRIK